MRVLLYVGPVVLWLGVIAIASTDIASQVHSDSWVWRVLRIFLGGDSDEPPSTEQFWALSWTVRKAAHLVEYAVLGLLTTRALRGLFPRFFAGIGREAMLKLAAVVLAFGALVAAADELYQSQVSSRTGSVLDALFDVVGVTVGLVVYWLVARRRRAERGSDAT